MVINAKISDALKTIGLNKYERNLWVALLARGSASAGELADISKVPRSRCYDVLESLADKGFVIVQPGKPLRYVSVQPREALEKAKKKITQDSIEVCNKIDRLVKSDTIKDLEKIHKDALEVVSLEDLSGALRGRYALMQQMEIMLKKAKKYANFITTENGLLELSENHGSLLQKVAKTGVKIRILAPINKNTSEVAKNLTKYAQIRDMQSVEHVEKMMTRMFVVDGEEVIVGLTDDSKIHPTQDVAFWTKGKHVSSNTFDPMFEMAWNNSKPVK